MESKLSPPLTMPPPLESKRPNHQSAQVPPPKMNGSDKLTRISQLEYCRGTSETPASEQEFPQLCRDVDRLDENLTICNMCAGVWTISVPENNLKYSKLRGSCKIHKKKLNTLISTESTEKENTHSLTHIN